MITISCWISFSPCFIEPQFHKCYFYLIWLSWDKFEYWLVIFAHSIIWDNVTIVLVLFHFCIPSISNSQSSCSLLLYEIDWFAHLKWMGKCMNSESCHDTLHKGVQMVKRKLLYSEFNQVPSNSFLPFCIVIISRISSIGYFNL